MNAPDPGYLAATVQAAIGYDVAGLEKELEELPEKRFRVRAKIAPLKAELAMLKARYDSKGRSPSHWDTERSLLLSELKEEERVIYSRDPEYKEAAKGRQVKIELTDGRAEDRAHAHPRYRKFVEEARKEHERMAEIGRLLAPLYDRLEVWAGREKFLTMKLEQARAYTYAWNASSRLG